MDIENSIIESIGIPKHIVTKGYFHQFYVVFLWNDGMFY
jgi:hypothetical protein